MSKSTGPTRTEWLESKLANRRSDGMTVIYHSVLFFLILSGPWKTVSDPAAAIEACQVCRCEPEAPLAWRVALSLEALVRRANLPPHDAAHTPAGSARQRGARPQQRRTRDVC